jgi:hypothetical protein
MESLLSSILVHAGPAPYDSWSLACSYWNWTFWIGFVAGVIGAIVSYFMKGPKEI